ncbi:MAG: hypothetical protein ABT940_00320 [Alphaproteobacteria bacterium]
MTRKPKVAVLVLNRNLPEETDRLCARLEADGGGMADVFVIESGSAPDKRSRYCRWWANWPDAMDNGLRVSRGFNFGLGSLYGEGRFSDYEYLFLVCNDTELKGPVIPVLVEEMERHQRLGILSPCPENWGELAIMPPKSSVYVWHIYLVAWMLRRRFVETMMTTEPPHHMNFLFDGTNFHGHYGDIELIIKGYINDWATGLTNRALIRERSELLKEKADVMVTTPYDENLRRVIEEGRRWMKKKYGFTSRWQMQQFAILQYNEFFRLNPDLRPYRLLKSASQDG